MKKLRKSAITNLKGSDEKLRVDWMISKMSQNKAFLYFSEKKIILKKKNY